ncbi:MBL fold metallo-hydrolase [Oxalicibacterium faecigallinarum]|uniref:Hydrolase n=1 Tax=Oxalicibacterium faecigallinarum TaxID=573741 RepID=A0A8J3AY78_9BURK|nr:MBL fold metallo-hydrolase [Oxalicibacterium faecigallinarum]GGI19184.1 hydrolase [Oxalicibacterium faecigallinarum]
MRKFLVITTGIALVVAFFLTMNASATIDYTASPQFQNGKFRNVKDGKRPTWQETPGLWWRFLFGKNEGTEPSAPLDVVPIVPQQWRDADSGTIWRLGHSTILMKFDGRFWLTDPVFSERASPVQWMGPKRFHRPPIDLADMPPLDVVIISHDHYDHLDKASVLALAERTRQFVTALGVGDLLIEWGVPANKVRQLDWWQSLNEDGITVTATPAQHFSGRSLFSGNATLWASWVIATPQYKLFFSGDTGYFDGFREIGERFGPFDLTMLEAGAYDPMWAGVHMLPEQVLQAHQDLGGKWMMPIHNSTFPLAFHPWREPLERVFAGAAERNIALSTPRVGEPLQLDKIETFTPWWRDADN